MAKIVGFLLFMAVTLYVLNSYYGFEGYDGYDDISYLRHAYFLPEKSWAAIFNYPHEQAQRLAFIIPLAWLIQVVGINDIAIQTACIQIALIGLFLVYHFVATATNNQKLAVLCTFLLATDYYYWYISNKVYPDILTTVSTFAALVLLYQAENQLLKRKFYPLFAIALFIAFLSKLTVFFILIFLSYKFILIFQSNNKKVITFWVINFWVGLGLLMAYFGVYYYFTDDAFFRFTQVETHRYADALSYFDKDFTALLQRLSYQPLVMFMKAGYIVNFILSLPLLVQFYNKTQIEKFWSKALLCTLAFYWWGSTSWQVYSPLPLDYRMAVVLSPIMAVLAGLAVYNALQKPHYQLFYGITFLLVGFIAYQFVHTPKGLFYGSIGAVWLGYYSIKNHTQYHFYSEKIMVIFFILLLLPIIYTISKVDNTSYDNEKSLLQKHLVPLQDSVVIYADSRLVGQIDFYYGFLPKKNHFYYSYDTLRTIPQQKLPTYILVNTKTIHYLEAYTGRKFPFWLQTLPQKQLVANYQGISLFKIH
jgi:hypothetical protein